MRKFKYDMPFKIGDVLRLTEEYRTSFPSIKDQLLTFVDIEERDTPYDPHDQLGVLFYDNKTTEFYLDTFYMFEKVL